MAEEQSAASSAAGDDRALLQRALAFHRAGRLDQAAAIYGRILAANADNVEALHFLGVIDAQYERFDQAAERLQRAVELQPDNPHFWSNLGTVRQAMGELAAAEEACRRAIQLKPQNADALTNFGNVLAAQGKLKDALTAYHAAVKIEPKHREALNNLGLTLRDLGKSELALSIFQEVVHLAPDFAEAHLNLADAFLAAGRFQEGWGEYAWRWKTRQGAERLRAFGQPQWDGEPLNGRRLLVWGEDDVDEQIFFASLLPELAALNGEVLVECAAGLAGLLDRSFPTYVLLPRAPGPPRTVGARAKGPRAEGDEVPEFDLQIPLAGLGGLFRKHRAAFPQTAAYLQPDGAVSGYLRRNYRELAEGRRVVGIAWRPSPAEAGPLAFPGLREWRPVLDTDGCLFIDLQHGQAEAEVAALVGEGVRIHGDPAIDPAESLDDFAAQLAALDLVIAAAGTTAHLAAAIGRPTFCLAPCGPSWRWLGRGGPNGQRAESQWYPGLRLFCPEGPGAWDGALQRIAAALKQQLAGCRPV